MTISYQVKITNPDETLIWKHKFPNEFGEYAAIKNIREKGSIEAPSCLKGLFVPLRTNNCKNFAKDLFLPLVVNGALKIECVVCRFFVLLLALPLDLLTFPIRVVMTIPRFFQNQCKAKHPLIIYLQKLGAPSVLLNEDFVEVTLSKITVTTHFLGRPLLRPQKDHQSTTKAVFLREVPTFDFMSSTSNSAGSFIE